MFTWHFWGGGGRKKRSTTKTQLKIEEHGKLITGGWNGDCKLHLFKQQILQSVHHSLVFKHTAAFNLCMSSQQSLSQVSDWFTFLTNSAEGRRDRWVRWSYLGGLSGMFQIEIEGRWVSRNCREEREEEGSVWGKTVDFKEQKDLLVFL